MKTRYIFIAAGFLALASGFIIASNQRQAVDLADAIIAKDAAAEDVTGEIEVIKSFVTAHMGVNVEVFRKGSYERAVQAAQAAANPGAQGDVYTRAQAACAGQTSSVSQSKCTSDFISANSKPAANPQAVAMPQTSDFTERVNGPVWSPDAAGLLLFSALFLVAGGVALQLRK